MNILLFCADTILPEFVRRPLEPLGHRVASATDSAAFRAALGVSKPAAVLIPRRPPQGDLAAALREVRKSFAPDEAAAIVLGLEESDRALAREFGADAFLRLPFSDHDLLEAVGAATRKRKLILLADDSPLIHRHTVPILAEAGYELLSAADGAEALRLARERRPDLVITDVEMPELDGYQLAAALKAGSETAHVPVLICSSLGEAQDLERGFDAGADDYLVKPVVPEEILTRVRSLLSGTVPASRELILVVDDSPAQRHYVADCLARQGFRIASAENGREGLARATELLPALVISDYEMPEMTGFELVHELKRNPRTRNIPIIMLTARDSRRDMAQMRAAGASSYLVKPFAQDKCIATVERTLAERRLLDYKRASSLYISEAARRAAEAQVEAGEVGAVRAEERVMSVLFTDIVGFTPMSCEMSPRQVIELLNRFFDALCPILVAAGGDIDKFIGDAIMAVFDELPGREPPPLRAVRAGVLLQAALDELNRVHGTSILMRVGINTGPLVRGDLGSRFVRRDFTVIGDTVNRASRYEANCPPGGVLISQSTRDAVGELCEVVPITGLQLKGVEGVVDAYLVTSIRPAKEPT
jgi:DNA-binding response OmpR family regulator